jgi:HPt (histidine-containing phosphotransfer) domain-containing protein
MSDLDTQLDALHRRYCASFAEKQAAIALAWSAVCADCTDVGHQDTLLNLVHRLAGSAQSYGYADIGLVAAEVDVLLDRVRAHKDPAQRNASMCGMLERLAPRLQKLLAALQQTVDRQRAAAASGD